MKITTYYIVKYITYFYKIYIIPIITSFFYSLPSISFTLYYIYIFIILIILFFFFYIKIKYPFWNIQPIFHTYDLWRYYTKTPFLIQHNGPLRTKFCKFDNIKTINFLECTNEDKNKCIDLLQSHYIPSDKILFTITDTILNNYMSGTDGSPFVSIYYEKKYEFIKNNNTYDLSYIDYPIGCMFSKPIYIFMYSLYKKPAYFWDYICIHREYKKYNLSRNIIQTHEYNQRIKSPDIPISIFKKENELCKGIVPITEYKTYYYYIHNLKIKKLPDYFTIIRIYKENMDLLFDFLHGITNYKLFDFSAIPSISNLSSLIINHNLYVFSLTKREHIYGFYFYKNMYTNYENMDNIVNNKDDIMNNKDIKGNAIQLIASINNSTSDNLFISGFLHSMQKILKINKYCIFSLDECSHNLKIKHAIDPIFFHIYSTNSAYYLYNYVCPGIPIKNEKCLFLL